MSKGPVLLSLSEIRAQNSERKSELSKSSKNFDTFVESSEIHLPLLAAGNPALSITGGLMLAEQRRQQLFPTASPLLASTWRAASIHTVSALGNGGPNYRSGWGIFDVANLVQLLADEESIGRVSLMKEFTVSSGASKTFYVTVPDSTQADLTLAWSDPARNPPAFGTVLDDNNAMLVNDLDLIVEDEAASPFTTHYPWTLNPDLVGEDQALRGATAVRTSMDDRNNVEKVTVRRANFFQ